MKIYLAGAMGCYGSNLDAMNRWRQQIKNALTHSAAMAGVDVIIYNPVYYYNFVNEKQKSEEEVMDFDLDLALSSDIIIVNTKDILHSPGTIIEIALAWKRGIPVLGFGDKPNHPWVVRCIRRLDNNSEELVQYIKEFYMS